MTRLKKIYSLHSFSCLALCEPLFYVYQLEKFRVKLQFHHVFANEEDRLRVFFDEGFHVSVLAQSDQFIAVRIVSCQLEAPVVAVFVHALCDSDAFLALYISAR